MEKRHTQDLDLGRHFCHRKGWTDEEDAQLTKYSQFLTDQEIADKLGRTVASIWSRRKRLRQAKVRS